MTARRMVSHSSPNPPGSQTALSAAKKLPAVAGGGAGSAVAALHRLPAHAVTLAATFACLAGVQIVLALKGSIIGFVTVFVLYSVILGVSETPASSILHRCVDDRQRSTMLSLRSLIQQLGAALGLVLAGIVADIYSTPIAWIVGAVFLFIAVILILVLVRRLAVEAE